MQDRYFKGIFTAIITIIFFLNSIAYGAPLMQEQDALRPSSEALSAAEEVLESLKTSSSGTDIVTASEDNLKSVLKRIEPLMDRIRLHGGFIFDIDDTLLTSVDGRPETLYDYPSVLGAICDLLMAGHKIIIATQTSYYEQSPRVVRPIVDILRKKGRLDAIKNFTMYTASGASKMAFYISKGRLHARIRHNYTDKNKIDKSDLDVIRATLQDLLLNWEEKIVRATSKRLSNLSEAEQAKIMAKLGIDDLKYETLREAFIKFQREGIKNKFKNADVSYLEGKKPPIRVYNRKFPPSDTDEAAPWIEFRDEVMIALRVAAFEDKAYPVFRDTMIEAIRSVLGQRADLYDIRPGGTSTIDMSKIGANKALAVSDIIRLKRSDKNLLFFSGDQFKDRQASDGVVLNVLPAENCLGVGGENVEINEALRIGQDHRAVHKFILALRNLMYKESDTLYESLRGADKEQALAARINGDTISEAEHRGEVGSGGINKIARIEILAGRARDVKQGSAKVNIAERESRLDFTLDYDTLTIEDNFFKVHIMPLLVKRVADLAEDQDLVRLGVNNRLLQNMFESWTIRLIPNWRKNCRESKITDDIIEHYGRKRILTLIDFNDYKYLKTQLYGDELIAGLMMHSFVHLVINSLDATDISQGQIEALVRKIAPIADAQKALNNAKTIDEYNQQIAISEQQKALKKIRAVLARTIKMAEDRHSFNKYRQILENLRHINLELNYMKILPENEKYYRGIVEQRHHLAMKISANLLRYQEMLDILRVQFFQDLNRYIEYAIESGITSRESGTSNLHTAKENMQAWLSPENHTPGYIRQGLIKGMLEGRSEDIIYNYGSNSKKGTPQELKGWKEFGTAGIRNEAVQSSSSVIRDLELEEFAKSENDPRVPILTGPYLINSVSLLKQAMTIIKLTSFIEYKVETGQWPDEVTAEEAKRWPNKFGDEFIENLKHKTVTIAYDSRLNGRYFAYLLAAVFFENDFKVNIFDNPSGVPGGVIVSNGAEFFGELARGHRLSAIRGSLLGVLISASHSEPWFNGFKVFRGDLRSQVDSSMKTMLKDTMAKIKNNDMPLALADKSIGDFEEIFKEHKDKLYWLGRDKPIESFNYCGGRLINFYDLYYDYLKKRSVLAHIPGSKQMQISDARNALKVLYTAFFGAGAVPAADYPGFLNQAGYKSVDIVKEQTEKMDGRFPGHLMPDPGVPEGWMSNLWNYLEQNSGKGFQDISAAVDILNSIEIGAATDPDIDRGGIMLGLPANSKGNIKDAFKEWVEKEIDKKYSRNAKQIKQKVAPALKNLHDKLLLSANDAWSFIAYYKLKVMEETGMLKKDRLYIIEKSHVTTSMIERIASYYSGKDKDYNIYVVDTYVGFTDLGKKSRDLFALAKQAMMLKMALTQEGGKRLAMMLKDLKDAYSVVKQRVPYETAGIGIVDEAISLAEDFIAEPNPSKLNQLNEDLNIIAHMDILMGIEESNGYGELGRYNPEKDKIEDAHIADKDGSLGVYQFLELVSYGKGLLNKSPYQMYIDMIREIGWVATDNQFLLYPGFQGNEQKSASVSAIEKILAMVSQRMLDHGQKVKMFGKYDLEGVTIYRDTKCDSSIYLGFPEEGIRFNLSMPSGVKGSATYRASGTGNNNRDYNWIEADKPVPSEEIEGYRNRINKELNAMIFDFFSHPFDTEGKSVPDEAHPSFLLALRNAVNSEQDVMALIRDALGIETLFSKAEHRLYKSVINFIDKPNDEESILKNERAWSRYLETEEAASYPVTIRFCINNRLIKIPNAPAKAWQASLVSYLSSLIRYEGAEAVKIACDDPQIAEFVAKRTRGIKIKIVPMPENPTVYAKGTRTDELIRAIEKAISSIRPDIPVEKIDAILRAHKHARARDIEELKKVRRLSEQVVLIHELIQEYAKNPQRMVLVYNPYETGQTPLSESENITEIAVICQDIVGSLAREATTIQSFNGSVITDGIWSYDIDIEEGKNHVLTDFEIEESGRGHGRFKDLTPIFNRYIEEGTRVFTKGIDAQGKVFLKEVNAKSSSAGKSEGVLFDPSYAISQRDGLLQKKPASYARRSPEDVISLLKSAKKPLSIIGHLRGVDVIGSQDIPDFIIMRTEQAAIRLSDIPATPTIASEFSVEMQFEALTDEEIARIHKIRPDLSIDDIKNSIVYVAPPYKVEEDNPYIVVGEIELTKNGMLPNGPLDAPAYIFRNTFSLKGIKITCKNIPFMATAGGMEASSPFGLALFGAASSFSGANWSWADIAYKMLELDNGVVVPGPNGGQGALATILGGCYLHNWYGGIKDEKGELINPLSSAFSVPIFDERESFKDIQKFIESHMMLVQAGKIYENGKALIARTASLINGMWMDLLREQDPEGLKLYDEVRGLAQEFTQALRRAQSTKDPKTMETVVDIANKQLDVRDALCRRWAECLVSEGKVSWLERMGKSEKEAIALYGLTAEERRDFDYSDINASAIKNLHRFLIAETSLYSDSARELIEAARKRGIALIPLGAGGPGANLIAISSRPGILKDFLTSQGLGELNEAEVKRVVSGTGTLKGFMPFRISNEPIKFIGFKELGLTEPALPIQAEYSEETAKFNAPKSSSSGISLNHLSKPEAACFLLDYAPTGTIEVPMESQAIIVYSDSLTESLALQEIIRSSKGDTRKFYLVNKESNISADELLKSLNIDRSIFQRHVFTQNSLTPDQLALNIAGFLHSSDIRQGRIFASTEEDLSAWSKQGLIEALVMLLKDKRFEIISDYSQQHTEYIKTHAQALIAA